MLRPATVAAAILAVLLAGMIAVQAAGVNLFGVRARWNDDILNITPGGKDNGAPSDRPASQGSVLDVVLTEQDLPLTLGPSKIPAGYSLSELKVSDTDDLKNVFACYTGENGSLSVSILQIHGKGDYFVERTPRRRRCTRQRAAAPSCSCTMWKAGRAHGATANMWLYSGNLKRGNS